MPRRRKGSAAAVWAADPWLDPRLLCRMFYVNQYVVLMPGDASTIVTAPNPDRWGLRFAAWPRAGAINTVWVSPGALSREEVGRLVFVDAEVHENAGDAPALVGYTWSGFAVVDAALLVTEIIRTGGSVTPPAPGVTIIDPVSEQDI